MGIDSFSSQILAIKLQFGDSVSKSSKNTHQDSDEGSNNSIQTNNPHQTSGIWSLSSLPINTAPTSTSPTKGWGIHSHTQTTSTITGGITTTIKPQPSAAP